MPSGGEEKWRTKYGDTIRPSRLPHRPAVGAAEKGCRCVTLVLVWRVQVKASFSTPLPVLRCARACSCSACLLPSPPSFRSQLDQSGCPTVVPRPTPDGPSLPLPMIHHPRLRRRRPGEQPRDCADSATSSTCPLTFHMPEYASPSLAYVGTCFSTDGAKPKRHFDTDRRRRVWHSRYALAITGY